MKLDREILRLSIPAVASNITVPILGLVDTAISGHLGSETFIGAIAVGSMMMNVAFWLFTFLRMGTTGLTAQALGSKDHTLCFKLLYQAEIVAMAIGILLIAVQLPLLEMISRLIGTEQEVGVLAGTYFRICIWESPALLGTMVILGWFLGMQDTVRPMIISIGVNIINIVFSLIFVFVCGLGFKGVALGTLCANWCGLALAIWLLWRFSGSWGGFRRMSLHELLCADDLKRFFKVNTDIFFRSMCIMGVSLGVTAIGARIGTVELAANAVLMQFFLFFSYFMDGLAFTGEALVGRFAGARDLRMLHRSIRRLLIWAIWVAGSFFVIYAFGYKSIISYITDQQDVIKCAESLQWFIMLIPPVTVAAFVFDGFFIGLTATRAMLVVTFVSAIVFFTVSFVHFLDGHISILLPNNTILWTAFLLYLLCRGALLAALTKRAIRNQIKVQN